MKFSVEQEELSRAVASAGRSTSQGRDNPALAGILIELIDGRLTVSATDGNRSIRIPVHLAGSPEGEGKVLLPGRVLPGLANSLRSGVVEVAYRPEKKDVEIKSGNSVFHVRTLNAEDFPPLPSLAGEPVALDRDVLVETIELVAGAASSGDMRPVLGAVLVNISGDVLTMAATDSYRLAVRETKLASSASEVEANVPADSLKELVRLLSGSETEQVKVSIGDREAVFDLDGTIFSTTMVEGQFPKYQQLFPESWECDVRLSRDELLEAIKRVGGVLDRDGRLIKVTLNPGELTLAAETPDLGDASETIPAGYEGEELTVGFDHTYFREGIDSIKGEEVMLKLISPLRPGLILPIGDESFRYLLMPLRLAD